MPELPEVEASARALRHTLLGNPLNYVWVGPKRLRWAVQVEQLRDFKNIAVTSVQRRGKYLEVLFANQRYWILHLGMSGRFIIGDDKEPRIDHTHWIAQFGERYIHYIDPRRFGGLQVCEAPPYSQLGIDPLDASFDVAYLTQRMSKSGQNIKLFLMDQRHIAGIGNIYASEALFLAKISPYSLSNTLEKSQIVTLHASILQILNLAVKVGGTTLTAQGYRDPWGQMGENKANLRVYGRQNHPCINCKQPIKKITQAQRSTYFCPQCQS